MASLVLIGALLLLTAGPASASCAPPPPPDQALSQSDLVFVGTVTELANRDRWAVFRVEDVWKGDAGGEQVEVRGGPADPGNGVGAATSVDRTYQRGVRYLVYARAVTAGSAAIDYGAGARWTDNACSLTRVYDPSLEQLRPATAPPADPGRPPTSDTPPAPPATTEAGDENRSWGWVPAVLTFAIILGVIFIPHKGRAKEPLER